MSRTEVAAEPTRYTRRGLLARAGIGAGALALGAVPRVVFPPPARSATVATSRTTFGRIFGRLPAFAPATDEVRDALRDLGARGGPLDAQDDLSKGPVLLITDPSLSLNNPNNPTHTAGTTFFGQFVDHDITFDAASTLGVPTDPETSPNSRTPSLDLDSVYGQGPAESPQLYDPSDPAKLRIESGGLFEDLARTGDGTAIVPDPRNDENLMIAGLHCAFIRFHNNAVDWAREHGRGGPRAFPEARRLTTWHYQWLVLHQFLPEFVGETVANDVLRRGGRFYRPREGEAFIPVEFQAAAYRFGHSMVRPSYRANLAGDGGAPFFGMIFDPAGEGQADPLDLRGGARAVRRFIGWQTFFDFGDGNVRPNKKIDTKISTPLFDIPLGAIPGHDQPQVLAQRNLLRQLTWSLPSGQAVAQAMRLPVLTEEELGTDLDEYHSGSGSQEPYDLKASTPLWYYVLREAEVRADGLTLGPVGGRIVAEVLVGLIRSDPASYLAREPRWVPTLTSAGAAFRMTDFLEFAGVDPASRGQ